MISHYQHGKRSLTEHLDLETLSMVTAIHRVPKIYRYVFEEYIHERNEAMVSGVSNAPRWAQDTLQAFDQELRLRWDYMYQCYAVDKFVRQWKAWVPLMLWQHEDGSPKRLGEDGMRDMLQLLHEGDMQRWDSPQKYIEYKRERAAFRRKQHETDNHESILAAVDSLSSKQIKNFIEVERAMRTGETIVAHGSMEKFMERAYATGAEREREGLPLNPGQAMNPWAAPNVHRRFRRD
jgi:hypothetical protein